MFSRKNDILIHKDVASFFLKKIGGIDFFLDDFGTATVPLRIFGVCLILIVIYDIWKNKDISQHICKTVYFPLFLIIWVAKINKERKAKKRAQRLKYYRPWYIL